MRPLPRSTTRGFTLIELMIVVAIVAILAAVALPSYRGYVMRGYVVDATTLLSNYQAQMERFYQDNRQYTATALASGGTVSPPCATGTDLQRTQGKFVVSCSGNTDLAIGTYRLTATGSGPVAGFIYTVDQMGNRTSTFPATSGWTAGACWITRKGQTC